MFLIDDSLISLLFQFQFIKISAHSVGYYDILVVSKGVNLYGTYSSDIYV